MELLNVEEKTMESSNTSYFVLLLGFYDAWIQGGMDFTIDINILYQIGYISASQDGAWSWTNTFLHYHHKFSIGLRSGLFAAMSLS